MYFVITQVEFQVIEHTDNLMAQETEDAVNSLQVVSVVSLPPVESTQTIETTIVSETESPPMSPQQGELMAEEECVAEDEEELEEEMEECETMIIKEEIDSSPESPKIVTFTQSQMFTGILEEHEASNSGESSPSDTATITIAGSFSPSRLSYVNGSSDCGNYITSSPSRPFSPSCTTPGTETTIQRLPSVLEAAMNAEPKVEVERCVKHR